LFFDKIQKKESPPLGSSFAVPQGLAASLEEGHGELMDPSAGENLKQDKDWNQDGVKE
jgi:hypothetical protein